MSAVGFNLRKWNSNSKELLRKISREESRDANEGECGGVTPPNNFNTRSQLQFDGDKSVPLWACMYRISVYNTLS